MALVSSGQISLNDIATEYGGSAPHNLSEYYDKGNAPASGEIQMGADFHGTSPYTVATGGTITYDGDYKIHTFTSSGTFQVTNVGDSASSLHLYDYLIAGAGGNGCSGGGSGGTISYSTGQTNMAKGSHTVTVGTNTSSSSFSLGTVSASGAGGCSNSYNGNYSYDHGSSGSGAGNYTISGSSLGYGGYGGGAYYGGGYVSSRQSGTLGGGNGGNGNDPQSARTASGGGGGGTWTKSAGTGYGGLTIRYKYQN